MKLDAFVAKIETIAPLALQESWDHSGWQLRLTDGAVSYTHLISPRLPSWIKSKNSIPLPT